MQGGTPKDNNNNSSSSSSSSSGSNKGVNKTNNTEEEPYQTVFKKIEKLEPDERYVFVLFFSFVWSTAFDS